MKFPDELFGPTREICFSHIEKIKKLRSSLPQTHWKEHWHSSLYDAFHDIWDNNISDTKLVNERCEQLIKEYDECYKRALNPLELIENELEDIEKYLHVGLRLRKLDEDDILSIKVGFRFRNIGRKLTFESYLHRHFAGSKSQIPDEATLEVLLPHIFETYELYCIGCSNAIYKSFLDDEKKKLLSGSDHDNIPGTGVEAFLYMEGLELIDKIRTLSMSEESKHYVLSKIIRVSPRTASGMMNRERKYLPGQSTIDAVQSRIEELKKT